MLWTMILVTIMHGAYSQGGDAVSSMSIHGFASKKACVDAGKMIEIPSGNDRHTIKSRFTCVPMGE